MDLYRVINFKGRSPESNLKKQEQQLLFYVEAKRGDIGTDSPKHHIKAFGNGVKAR